MKKYFFLGSILLLINCARNEETENSIVGSWRLKESHKNNVKQTLSDCELRTTLQIPSETKATFYIHYTKDDTCLNKEYPVKLYLNADGSYKVKPPSVFDQKQLLVQTSNTLIYTWESWEIVDTSVNTTPIKEIYRRE